jgi:hypothetical protein
MSKKATETDGWEVTGVSYTVYVSRDDHGLVGIFVLMFYTPIATGLGALLGDLGLIIYRLLSRPR